MHAEHFTIDEATAEEINRRRKAGGRIIAVGTTSCRVLESITDEHGTVHPADGETAIFIYPGYKFKAVDALITNFHLPESTLIMLVSALAGKENVMNAYETAVREKYRFFSFGDAMLIVYIAVYFVVERLIQIAVGNYGFISFALLRLVYDNFS